MPTGLPSVEQTFTADVGGYVRGVADMIAANKSLIDSVNDAIRKVAELSGAVKGLPDSKTIKIDVDAGGALAKIAEIKKALDGLGDIRAAGGGILGGDAAIRELRDISASMDMATSSMGRMEEHLTVISRNVQDSSADLMMQTQILRDNADAHTALAAAMGAAAAAGGRGGGGGAIVPVALGGGGGGGGGGGFAAGTAAAAFANVARFTAQWYPAAHWAMMLTNEVLATVGPAAVAAGGAALVGYQGGQQLLNRYQAMNAVAESLGPSTGQSMATFLRVPNTLQQLQNMYGSGEMYGIAGAGINALRAGAGGPFLALGQQTLSMLSGAAANFVLAIQGGLAKTAGTIVQGGTGYLQQFGDVAGNIGKIFMNTAPNLPGVGGMLLSLLQAGTGGIADVTKALGPGLLPVLGFEAGARWGPAIVGGGANILAKLGLGTVGKAGTGLAGFLGDLSGPEIGGIAAATLAVVHGLTAKTAAQQYYAGIANNLILGPSVGGLTNLVSGVGTIASAAALGGFPGMPGVARMGEGGFFGNVGAIGGGLSNVGRTFGDQTKLGIGAIADLFTGKWSDALHNVGSMWQDLVSPGGIIHGLGQMLGIVGPPPDASQAAMQQMKQAFSTWSNVLGAPGQVKDLWKELGGGALSTAQALDVLAQSGVNINTAFAKNGELTAKAAQQVKDYVAGYQAVTGGGATGGTLAAINAGTIIGGLQASKLATVNANFDQIVQIASGGASGTAAYETLLRALPKGAAGALGNILSPAGSAAWTAFASTTQPSVISQLQQQTDWLRTAQVLGAFGGGGGQTAMAKFLIGQALPAAGKSPMAMAVLSSIAQQYGMAPVMPGESAKAMQQQFASFLQGGYNAKQYQQALTAATERVSNIPMDEQQFITTASGGMQQALAQAVDMHAQSVQNAFMGGFGKGGMPSGALIGQYARILGTAGYSPTSAAGVAGYAALVSGASQAQIQKIMGQIKADVQVQVNAEQAKAALQAAIGQNKIDLQVDSGAVTAASNAIKQLQAKKVNIDTNAGAAMAAVAAFKAALASIQSAKVVNIQARADAALAAIQAVQHALSGLHNETVTVTAINRVITQYISQGTPPGYSGPVNAVLVGSGGTHIVAGGQTGMLVPGTGSGDIFPALLEPGEAVVPRRLVPGLAPWLKAHGVPGFASGSLIPPMTWAGPNATGLAMLEAMLHPASPYAGVGALSHMRSSYTGVGALNIHINTGGGGISDADVRHVTEKVQAALLRQARRNPRTGLQLSRKGA